MMMRDAIPAGWHLFLYLLMIGSPSAICSCRNNYFLRIKRKNKPVRMLGFMVK